MRWAVGALLVGGCAMEVPAGPDLGQDTATGESQLVVATGALDSCLPPPEGPYGLEVDRAMEPFTLRACDGTEYALYGDERCDARFTVVNIVAGWCCAAIKMSRALEEEVVQPYASRGVRVVTVITETEEYGAPDEAYCRGFAGAFGLTNAVLIDPEQVTGVYFPGNALPATLIIDPAGTIRYRSYGYLAGELPAALDALLGGEELEGREESEPTL